MPTSAKHLPADERRAATVQAVIHLASQHNPAEITTSAIANQMHLTQGALFRHFKDKAAIWESVLDWVADQLLKRVGSAAEATTDPLEALEAVYLSHIDFVAGHPGVPRMLFGELQRLESTPAKRIARRLIERYKEKLAKLINDGQRQGAIAQDIDQDAAVALFIGSIQGLVMQSLLIDNPDQIRTQAPRMFALIKRGLITERRKQQELSSEP